ncbi:unnamed protein product [Moneuplotes crassus]|uniref:Uncharacterized protein n=1 Tax=Euplotes crassus TaxID=5936 RepID=A0AAD1YA19_EUPCR|nr:unnamed protein product [Moneuplotes crassus]
MGINVDQWGEGVKGEGGVNGVATRRVRTACEENEEGKKERETLKITTPTKAILKNTNLNTPKSSPKTADEEQKQIQLDLIKQRRNRHIVEREIQKLAKKDPSQLAHKSSVILKRIKTRNFKRNNQLASLDNDRSRTQPSLAKKINNSCTLDHSKLSDLEKERGSVGNNNTKGISPRNPHFDLLRSGLKTSQFACKEEAKIPNLKSSLPIQNITQPHKTQVKNNSEKKVLNKIVVEEKKELKLDTLEDLKDPKPSPRDLEKLLEELDDKSEFTKRSQVHKRGKSFDCGIEFSRNQSGIQDKTKATTPYEPLPSEEGGGQNELKPRNQELDSLHKELFGSKKSMGWNF